MPIPLEKIENLRRALNEVVLASRITPDNLYYGNALMGKGISFMLSERRKEMRDFLMRPDVSNADRNEYAKLLYEYALIANHRKVSIYGWNASRDYRNAMSLFEEASQLYQVIRDDPSSKKLKANMLIDQANFLASIAKDSSGFLRDIQKQKTPQEIHALYQEALVLGNELNDDNLQEKAAAGIREQYEIINASQSKPARLKSALSSCFEKDNLADVNTMVDGKIQIDPASSWYVGTKHTGTSLVNEIITKLGLNEGKDFTVQKHMAPRTDKFIIEPKNFDKWLGILQERGYIKGYQADQVQQLQKKSQESDVSSASLTPISRPPYTVDRILPLSDDQVRKIQIPKWEVQRETLTSSVTRFVQPANEGAYVDIDKQANKISSNSASVEAFEAVVNAFQGLYGKTNLPTITLSGSANNEQSRENCKVALVSSGYNASQVKEIMSLLLVTPALLATAPEADPSSREASHPLRGSKP